MKKGEIYEGVVQDIRFPNKGVVCVDGQTVIVKNALPEQKIRFSVTKLRGGKAEGRLLNVLARGKEETTPACGCFGECGGCLYLSLPYERQLAIKERQIRDLLTRAVNGEFEFEGILPSPEPYGYRNKMEFSFGDACKDGPLALGMHKRGSFYDIVTADRCRIVDADFRLILSATLSFFQKYEAAVFQGAVQDSTDAQKTTAVQLPADVPLFYHRMRHEGFLRHLLVRKGKRSGEILIDLVTTSQGALNAQAFTAMLLSLNPEGTIAGILHTVNDSLADVVQNDRTDILYGQDYFYEELLGLQFKITPFSFFQTNSLGAEVLYETARRYVGYAKDKTVFDLYSGTGTIAQLLAPVAKKVVGVELVPEAVGAARENAAANGITNCEFLAGDVLKVIDEITDKPDFIVLDPPRDGVNPKALQKIIHFGVERMIYISCKPTSLARDLGPLQEAGYRVERAAVVDMFPWTANAETVVLLSKLKSNKVKHINVELEMDELDLTSAERC